MDYEDILLNLTRLAVIPQSPLAGYFDSKIISDIFRKHVSVNAMPVPLSRFYPPHAFGVKRISGDLDKLYRMGLLKRKRVKRLFRTSDGNRLFGRGYMYLYRISPQGWKYALYLAENYGVPREERKKKRCEGFWPEDEVIITMMARSNVSVPAAVAIAEERKKQLPQEEGIHRRFPILFDDGLYARYLVERMDNVKTNTELKKSMSEAEDARFKALVYKKASELNDRDTPLQLLMRAKDMAEKENNDPEIYPEGIRELAALGLVKSNNVSSARLSELLGWIIRELMHMGYKLSK